MARTLGPGPGRARAREVKGFCFAFLEIRLFHQTFILTLISIIPLLACVSHRNSFENGVRNNSGSLYKGPFVKKVSF